MENIIKQVIESEYRAQRIINEVQYERKRTEDRLQDQLRKVKEEILLSTSQKIDKTRTEKLEQARLQAEAIISDADERALMMKRKFEENRESWIKQLFDSVVECHS